MELKIKALYANEIESGGYGDIFETPEQVKTRYPQANVLKGYGVCYAEPFIFENTHFEVGHVPTQASDWHDSLDSAIEEIHSLYNQYAIANPETAKEMAELIKVAYEEAIYTHYQSVDDLLAQGYLFYNWQTKVFEDDFMCENAHINETYRNDWELIQKVARENNAFVATVLDTAPLMIIEGVHYCNRYGYIAYKGAQLKEDYYI